VPERHRENRWFLAGFLAIATIAAIDLAAGDTVEVPVGAATGPLIAALGARVRGVIVLAALAVAVALLLSIPADSFGTIEASVRTGVTAAIGGVAVLAAHQRDRRERELHRSRPVVLLHELGRSLVSCRNRDEVIDAFQAWAGSALPAMNVELWLGPELTSRAREAGSSIEIPLAGPAGPVGVVRAAADPTAEPAVADLLSQAADLVSIALDRSGFVDELATTARRLHALQEATARLAAAERVHHVADAAVRAGREALDADVALLYERRGDEARLLDADGLDADGLEPDDLDAWNHLSLDATVPMDDPADSGATLRLGSRADVDARYGYVVGSDDSIEEALIASPIEVDGVTEAVLYLGFERPRTFSPDDLLLLDSLTTLIAHALKRARQLDVEEEERWLATRRAHRAEVLDKLTVALSESDDSIRVAQRFIDDAIPALSASWGAIFGLDESGCSLRLVATEQIGDDRTPSDLSLDERGALTDAVRERQPVLLGSLDDLRARYPHASAARDEAAWAAVPLVVGGDVIGAMGLGFSEPQDFDDELVGFLTGVAERLAQAFERARVREAQQQEDRRWALTVQEALLPGAVRPIPGTDVAVRYEASGAHAGGDWYDVVPLDPQILGLAVGDVVGHGIDASAEMARYRSALRAYALAHRQPDRVMQFLRRFAAADEFETMATILYGIVDVGRSTFTYSAAGHLPPLRVRRGEPTLLDARHGPPIGLDTERVGCSVVDLEAGDTIVLYTDGLVERRGETIDRSLDRLKAVVGDQAWTSPRELCDALIDVLVGDDPRDDVAIVAVRFGAGDQQGSDRDGS
jgi:serine phosphatase RsbU (regulator of sigma subunit)